MNKLLVYLVWCSVVLASCSSGRHLPFESFSLEPVTSADLNDNIRLTENAHPYTQISRFSADYSGWQEQSSFKGFARIALDSLVLLSLSPGVGGEAIRLLLSADSSKVINRMESTYFVRPYEVADQMIPLPFSLLQSILSYHFTSLLTADYELSIKDKMYLLEDKTQTDNYTSLAVDGHFMVRKVFYKDFKQNSTVNVVYGSFLDVDGKLFPEAIDITIHHKKEVLILRLTVKRVEFRSELSFPFHVSSRYIELP